MIHHANSFQFISYVIQNEIGIRRACTTSINKKVTGLPSNNVYAEVSMCVCGAMNMKNTTGNSSLFGCKDEDFKRKLPL